MEDVEPQYSPLSQDNPFAQPVVSPDPKHHRLHTGGAIDLDLNISLDLNEEIFDGTERISPGTQQAPAPRYVNYLYVI